MKKFAIVMTCFLLSDYCLKAQLVTVDSKNFYRIVDSIVGSGVTFSNVTANCGGTGSSGVFSNGTVSCIGKTTGAIITTGTVTNAKGPNNSGAASSDLSQPKSLLAEQVAANGQTSYDACVIEFDIVPQNSYLSFEWIFGSEEYTEYVGSSYTDAFGLFIKGGSSQNYTCANMAVVPFTNTQISINTVNPTNNGSYYKNNTSSSSCYNNIQYDGLVQVKNIISIVPNQTYHILLVIADIGDGSYDSGLLVPSGGLNSPASASVNTVPVSNNTIGQSYQCEPPLPVTLIDFSAEQESNGTMLYWATANEQNNHHFEVERATITDMKRGGVSNFATIKKLPGMANTTQTQYYSYMDDSPVNASTVYYRLKQVDLDGSASYSKIILVRNKAATQTAHYNSALGEIVYKSDFTGSVKMSILNTAGQVVRTKAMEKTSEQISWIPEQSFQGIYLLLVEPEGKEKYVQRISFQ
jgi:hypothetical protein